MGSIETQNLYPKELVVPVLTPEELVPLAEAQLEELRKLNRTPVVIVTALEEFLIHRNPDLTIIKTADSIAIMVGTQLITIYSSVLHENFQFNQYVK